MYLFLFVMGYITIKILVFYAKYSTLRLLYLADERNYDITGVTILNRFYSEIKQ